MTLHKIYKIRKRSLCESNDFVFYCDGVRQLPLETPRNKAAHKVLSCLNKPCLSRRLPLTRARLTDDVVHMN